MLIWEKGVEIHHTNPLKQFGFTMIWNPRFFKWAVFPGQFITLIKMGKQQRITTVNNIYFLH